MSEMFERVAPELGARPRHPEVHLATVTDVRDPDGLGRVEIRLLSFDGADGQSAPIWARVAVPVAGSHRGTFLLPDIGDEVLVSFVGGDPRRPIVTGSMWNGRDAPTEDLGSRGVDRWSFTSKDGTRVSIVEETEGSSTFKIEVPGDVTAELTQSAGGKIEIKAAGNTITIDNQGVTVDSSATVTVNASRVSVSASSVSIDTPMATFSTTVQCQTLIATSVVGGTYTMGAGNVW